MKRIGLVSDSHGKTANLKKAIEQMGEVDLIFHMGDYIQDADLIKTWTNTPVMAVRGNMDSFERERPLFIKTNIEGHNIYVAHGHGQQVKWGTEKLAHTAKANGCDIALYGHTHRKDFSEEDGVLLINPGSCSLPNDDYKSYGIMTIDGPEVDCQFYKIED